MIDGFRMLLCKVINAGQRDLRGLAFVFSGNAVVSSTHARLLTQCISTIDNELRLQRQDMMDQSV
jgi:hypothetical protein